LNNFRFDERLSAFGERDFKSGEHCRVCAA
jgi:hypothetical protein